VGLRDGGVVEEGEGVVACERSAGGGVADGDGEVVAQGVDEDDDGLVEGFGVPAAGEGGAEVGGGGKRGRREGAGGLGVEDEAGEEEAFGEEVNSRRGDESAVPTYQQPSVSTIAIPLSTPLKLRDAGPNSQ